MISETGTPAKNFCCAFVTLLVFLKMGTCTPLSNVSLATEKQARAYLNELEDRNSAACNRHTIARWSYTTNIAEHTKKNFADEEMQHLNFEAQVQKEILREFNWQEFQDEDIKRELRYLSIQGPGKMAPIDMAAMTQLLQDMQSDYSTARVCGYEDPTNCTFRLDPEIEHILSTSTDPKILAHYWTAWHDKMSERVPPSEYQRFLHYQRENAKANGFNDMSEKWMAWYDDGTPDWTPYKFKLQMLDIWEEIRPMYTILHAYVRMKLGQIPEYKDEIEPCGYIPAHLTGNMWAQHWNRLDELTKPYPKAPKLDATEAMIRKNYTPLKIFQEADKFFTNLGLYPMTETFWRESMLERPHDNRDVVCHASAEDFCLGEKGTDYRIKQCTKVNMEQLIVAHHEMGHVEYYQQYKHLHLIFRDGANPGFHEAIGDALGLSAVTPKHLQCILGLELDVDPMICASKHGKITETDINFLYHTALYKLVLFPFAISMDMWRWEAFEGKLAPEQYNQRWWELRMKNQGTSPATDRFSPNLFDPAAKYHIVSNVEYIRYFISHVLQFQFYEAMCIAAGQFDPNSPTSAPLHQCDFSGSKKAGKLLGDMMKLGFSKPWPVALEAITGSRTMSTSSVKKYFQPLLDHMADELKRNKQVVGFGGTCGEYNGK